MCGSAYLQIISCRPEPAISPSSHCTCWRSSYSCTTLQSLLVWPRLSAKEEGKLSLMRTANSSSKQSCFMASAGELATSFGLPFFIEPAFHNSASLQHGRVRSGSGSVARLAPLLPRAYALSVASTILPLCLWYAGHAYNNEVLQVLSLIAQ